MYPNKNDTTKRPTEETPVGGVDNAIKVQSCDISLAERSGDHHHFHVSVSDTDDDSGFGTAVCGGSQSLSNRKLRLFRTGTHYSEILSSNAGLGEHRTLAVSAATLSVPDLNSSRRVGIVERATGMRGQIGRAHV